VQFGIDQGSDTERAGRLKEALQIIPALWSGESVTFQGRYYRLANAFCSPRSDPPPRLIVGARGPGLARLAGRYADGLNLQWRSRDRYQELFDALDAGLAARERTRAGFDLSVYGSWRDVDGHPAATLEQWAQLGFTRAIVYVEPPFPIAAFASIARAIGI
jgi:alkanesulfonate monooxygenase SsuD/methylene tetrahydromethanopterin reductase-like flavin-dependent oxidoreductase (luciferase family)